MKKRNLFIIFITLFIFFLTGCNKNNENNINVNNEPSSSEKFLLYSELQEKLNDASANASASDYYKSIFSYDVSYTKGRTDYNIITVNQTCDIRNDSLYVNKKTTYSLQSLSNSENTKTYVEEDGNIYCYTYEREIQTLDTEEILPIYSVSKEEDFNIRNVMGFSQSIITSEGFDGTNGKITKDNNKYEIIMDYATVKDEVLVKFIYNLGYFKNMTYYVKEEDLDVIFTYTFTESGYNLDYGFSYQAEDRTINAKVTLGLNKIDPFEIFDFKDETKYVKRYPQNIESITDIHKVEDKIDGRYPGSALFKFYLQKGKYGVTSNGKPISNYSIYKEDGSYLPFCNLNVSTLVITTAYFEIEEDGYYYIYLDFNYDVKSFKLEEIKYNTYLNDSIKNLDSETIEGKLEGLYDYEAYKFDLEGDLSLNIKNNTDHDIALIIPIYTLLSFVNYRTVLIKANESVENIKLSKGIYYIIITPAYANNGLDYSLTISSNSIV